jgi:hypothetical protein
MAGSPNSPNSKSNTPRGGGGGNGDYEKRLMNDMEEKMLERLKKGERVEIFTMDVPKVEGRSEEKEEEDTLNLRVNIGERSIGIRSGGWLILIVNDKRVVAVRDEQKRVYENACLAVKMRSLLQALLAEYNVQAEPNKWVRVSLPRSDRLVRRFQAWILASINNTFDTLWHNPLKC